MASQALATSKNREEDSMTAVEGSCARLRELADQVLAAKKSNSGRNSFSKLAKEFAFEISELRHCSRESYLNEDVCFSSIKSIQNEVESQHLELQNLLYEKAYLLQEIHRCKAYELTYTKRIKLLDYDEFKKKAPSELSKETEQHKLLLNRLAFELTERKKLVSELKTLREQRIKIQTFSTQKQTQLSKIPDYLNQIEKSTLPLQDFLKLNVTKRIERHAKCRELPTPLYILYNQLEAYGDAYGGVAMYVETVQDEQKPGNNADTTNDKENKKVQAKPRPSGHSKKRKQNDDEDDEEMDSENEMEAEFQKFKAISQIVRAKLTSSSDDSNSKDQVEVMLRFEYLKDLGVVTVMAENHEALLANLFPNDTGEYLPKSDSGLGTSGSGQLIPFPKNFRGKAYKWVQWLAGFDYLDPASSSFTKPTTSHIVESVLKRIRAQELLSTQLKEIAKLQHPIPVPKHAESFFPSNLNTKLSDWREISKGTEEFDEYSRQLFSTQLTVPVYALETSKESLQDKSTTYGMRCFVGTFETSGNQGCPNKITFVVHIFVDYPTHMPHFMILNIAASGGVEQDLRIIQNEINAFATELMEAGPFHLLSLQMRRLQMCLDVVNGDVDRSKQTTFGRKRRGRDRRLALVYDTIAQKFKHR